MEAAMAKGQVRGNKEPKKPKSDQAHPKKGASSPYQQSQHRDEHSDDVFKRKS
jgi:hypothetical protein